MAQPFPYIFQSLYRWLGFSGASQYSGQQLSGPGTVPTASPINLTEDAALAVSAVFGACRLLAETIAGMPMFVYLYRSGQWVQDINEELYALLQLRPNPHMTAVEFWECVMLNLAMRGNGYALIIRNDLGMPIGLYPLAAAQVQPIVLKDGSGWYIYNLDGTQTMYGADDVLHFRIFGNGRIGLSPLEYGARVMGVAASSDMFAGTFFAKGAKPGGALTIDRLLTPAQRKEVRENFKDVHEGAENAHKMYVLEAGMKYQAIQLSPEAVQLIATRRYSVKDVARFWGVPAFLLNENEGSTSWGTGLEQQMLGFYNLTCRPYMGRIASRCSMQLVPLAKQRRMKVMYDYDELLSVDLKAKAEYLRTLIQASMMTPNEGRAKLSMPRMDTKYADELLAQGAMIPLSKAGEKAASNPSVGKVPDTNPEKE